MTQTRNPLGIVCDCMVFLQAVANDDSPAAKILDLMDAREIRLYVSERILREAREVMSRPRLRAKLPGLTDERVEALFLRLEKQAFWLREIPDKFDFRRDPKDAPYVNLAVAAAADFIISRDHDLLDLTSGHDDDSKEFRQRFRPLKVITPETLLAEVERSREQG
ncbi:MAG: putative toxin-antitoxin system toxin component, PIN family [Acidobacteria bacterium]|nr:putative toxin-antitoxin system toxin component, PIN family [Acidobacteriota bacterium]